MLFFSADPAEFRKPPNCGIESNFRITALPTFVNQSQQIPFPRVYVSINERRLKLLMNMIFGRYGRIIEDFLEEEGDFVTGNVSV